MSEDGQRRRWIGLLVRTVLVVIVVAVVIAVIRSVDWSEVAEATRQLTPWMIPGS